MNTKPTTSSAKKKSKAVLRLEAIRAKETDLAQHRVAAEAAVAQEKHAEEIAQGLHDFLGLMKQKDPDEIDAIITTAISDGTPIEVVESIQHWSESVKASRFAQAQEIPQN